MCTTDKGGRFCSGKLEEKRKIAHAPCISWYSFLDTRNLGGENAVSRCV